MSDHQDQTGSFECVQPELGHQIWRLEMNDTSDDLRNSLENHLAVCDSCRLTLAAEVLVKESARDNSLKIVKSSPVKRLLALNFNLVGSISLAASLALALLMPPSQLESSLVRGDGAPGFIRPVEGETIRQDTPELTWNAVPGATAYRVEISGVGNDYQWETQSQKPSVVISSQHPVPKDKVLRAVIQPVPDDLVPLGSISVTFKREGLGQFFIYRIGAASNFAKFLGLLGLLFLNIGYLRTKIFPSRLKNY